MTDDQSTCVRITIEVETPVDAQAVLDVLTTAIESGELTAGFQWNAEAIVQLMEQTHDG